MIDPDSALHADTMTAIVIVIAIVCVVGFVIMTLGL